MSAIYIHIPFCLRKCFYCDFNSIPVGRIGGDGLVIEEIEVRMIARYVSALCKEIEGWRKILEDRDFSADSIYIGGGTPSLLNKDQTGNILDTCRVIFGSKIQEITIEANPGTISSLSSKDYLWLGINRLSLGCQSFDNEELKKLGRVYNGEDIYRSFELAKEAGFENINIDLIFGIPGQDSESFASSLQQAISFGPQHFSLYNLSIEENTHFQHLLERGELELPDEDEQIAMYEYGIKTLKEKGYEHYEISNFALQGKRCWHNVNYWRGGEYLGFGAGAHSFASGLRSGGRGQESRGKERRVESSELRVKSSRTGVPPVSSPSPFPLSSGGGLRRELSRTVKVRGVRSNVIASHELVGRRSNLSGRRWWNLRDIEKYCEALEKDNTVIEGEEELGESKFLSEAMMLGLRMIEGIDTKEFFKKHGVLIEERYEKEIEDLKREGLLEFKRGRFRLTHKGVLFSNEVFLRFMA